ncbi:MAG: hypothetical protein KAJ51_13055 [Thermoplasmata archaeon]|nr:hypothetical protein [Thermoplasmata archaeon]
MPNQKEFMDSLPFEKLSGIVYGNLWGFKTNKIVQGVKRHIYLDRHDVIYWRSCFSWIWYTLRNSIFGILGGHLEIFGFINGKVIREDGVTIIDTNAMITKGTK